MLLIESPFWRDRIKACVVHLGLSLTLALLAALLVFGLWYPYPYRELSGGRELFILLVSVDVILGPLMTLVVFTRTKPWRELLRDLTAIGLMQLAALGYGLWSVSEARPVHLVFEYDRFRLVHAVDVPQEWLSKIPAGIEALPLSGPTLLSLRPFRNQKEKIDATMLDVQGLSLAFQPEFWQPYEAASAEILAKARPVSVLKTRFPDQAAAIDQVLGGLGINPQTVVYLPLASRKAFWTVFLDSSNARILAFMPLDPF
ncbi:MAG: pilus assembly protein [Rhodoferax sp.]|nr:pilus assembly protein [Rhodoferax sp.]